MASVGIRSLDAGGQPVGYTGGDVYHYALMRILIAARARGAVMFGDEMIDEASHKMARAIVARARAAGLGHDDPRP